VKSLKIILLVSTILFASCKVDKAVINHSKPNLIDVKLKKRLEAILIKDQGIREIVNGNLSQQRKAELLFKMNLNEEDVDGDNKYSLMREIDSINLSQVESIIKKYGYPSKTLVGEPANKAVFYVIQHSDKIDEYLPLIRKATENGDIAETSLALMEDRNLMNKGFEQIYGTQIKGKANKNGEWIFFLWPVKDPDSINVLRRNAGFEQTIEKYLENMEVEVKFYKLHEIDDL